VVGAAARVLLRTAAELGPRRDEDAVGHPVRREVLVERRDRGVEVRHEVGVPRLLGVVRVEATEGHVQDLHPRAGDDELGREL